jgi:hypothetical protein
MYKRPMSFGKLRQVPRQCSWGDQRLVRARYIDQLRPEACALSLCLGTVADAQGLRFSSAPSLGHRLSMDHLVLHRARQALSACDLVAYDPPLYQVLALDAAPLGQTPGLPSMPTADTPMALKDIFQHMAETLS